MGGEPPPTATAETRKLAAIMFTDMVGFSRQMGANEARMLRLLEAHNQVIQQAVAITPSFRALLLLLFSSLISAPKEGSGAIRSRKPSLIAA